MKKTAPDQYPSLRGAGERLRFWSQWRRLTSREAQTRETCRDSGSAKQMVFRRNSLENIDVVQMHGVHSGEYYLKPGLDARSPPDKRDWRAVRSQQRSSGQAQVWSQNGTGWNLWKKDHSILNNHLLALRYFWVNFTKPVKNMS